MPYDEVMSKFKSGKLHSGSKGGPKVKSRSQAVAIMLSEKRAAGAGKKEYQSRGKGPGGVKTPPRRGKISRRGLLGINAANAVAPAGVK